MKLAKLALGILFVLNTPVSSLAAGNQGYYNEQLLRQGMPQSQYQSIFRGDDLQCQADAKSKAFQILGQQPGPCDLNSNPYFYSQCNSAINQYRDAFIRNYQGLYSGCLASHGWVYGDPPAPPEPPKRIPDPPPVSSKPKNSPPTLANTGTGFFVSASGQILTNAHVVENCDKLMGRLSAGPDFQLRLQSVDGDNDLALLTSVGSRPFATFRRGSSPLGERVVVFGFPLAGTLTESGNLTTGAVSGLAGLGGDPSKYQISAPVQPGNSGGAVLDESGLVIGVVQSKLDAVNSLKATGDIPQNVNFAIKGSVAQNFLEAQGVKFVEKPHGPSRKESALATDALKFTVLIGCYRS
jgi:S1-C subfamily serine protease